MVINRVAVRLRYMLLKRQRKTLANVDLQGYYYVRSTGLEPVPVAGHAPQTCAYADSATTADEQMELYGPENTLSRIFIH